jgi:hypothetical protein
MTVNSKEFGARVDVIHANATKVDKDIQSLGVDIIEHLRTGDYTQMQRLLVGMPKGTRVQHLARWFEEFSSIKSISKDFSEIELRKDHQHNPDWCNVNGATENVWSNWGKSESTEKPFKLEDMIKTLTSQAAGGGKNNPTTEAVQAWAAKFLVELQGDDTIEKMPPTVS